MTMNFGRFASLNALWGILCSNYTVKNTKSALLLLYTAENVANKISEYNAFVPRGLEIYPHDIGNAACCKAVFKDNWMHFTIPEKLIFHTEIAIKFI